MTSRSKSVLALAATAALLAGCATGPYYDSYGNHVYNDGSYYYDRPAYRYYEGPAYYAPAPYVGPSVGFGIAYSNRGYYRRY